MALREPWLLKTVLGTTKPQLKADPGEAFMIKNIMVRDPNLNYLTLKVEKTTVGYLRVGGALGSHAPFRRGRAQHSHTIRVDGGASITDTKTSAIRDGNSVNRHLGLRADASVPVDVYDEVRALLWSGFHHNESLLSFLGSLGIFKGFPIAEGETFTVEGMEKSADSITLIVYEQWDPADIKPEMENGSKSKEYFFLNYGNTGASINTSGDQLYDTPVTPAEFPDFPYGKVVPAKHEIDLIGIAASPFAPGENDGTNYTRTKWIKLMREREILFDEDRNGILFWSRHAQSDGAQDMKGEGFTLIGNLSEYDNNPPLIFPQPLKFVAGDELNVYVNTETGGTPKNIDIYEQEICLIQKVKRVE
ncbi:MAG: hypothetical protein FJ110_05520 [Deltaproteobacteria bacterium]|nr:hypothetical protein [Deltaproteobacteria bacterium]